MVSQDVGKEHDISQLMTDFQENHFGANECKPVTSSFLPLSTSNIQTAPESTSITSNPVTTCCRIRYNNVKAQSLVKDVNSLRYHPYERKNETHSVNVTSRIDVTNGMGSVSEIHLNEASKGETEDTNNTQRQSGQTETNRASLSSSNEQSTDTTSKTDFASLENSIVNCASEAGSELNLPSTNDSVLIKEDGEEDEKSSQGPPQREPVVLPDPLPSYIKRVERPAGEYIYFFFK